MSQKIIQKKCCWCDELVDPTLCFAAPSYNRGWLCELCGRQVLIDVNMPISENERDLSPPSDQQE